MNGTAVALRGGSERLVAYLALADRTMERARVAFVLWPETTEDRALANLRTALWRLRTIPTDLLNSNRTRLRIDAAVWVDARQPASSAVHACGELLPDWYDDWLVVERERLRQRALHALEAECARLIALGQCGEAIDVGIRAVSMEPLRESAHRAVIAAHLAEGNCAEAMRQFATLRHLLASELGVAPSAATAQLLAAHQSLGSQSLGSQSSAGMMNLSVPARLLAAG